MSKIRTNPLLLDKAGRLGIQDNQAIKKAEEFLRVINNKGALKTVSEDSKAVLCLDLSTKTLGVDINKELALKLTGSRKPEYQNNLNIIEKMLDLDTPVTIPELCVQLSCTTAKETALTILQGYFKSDSKIKDNNHPQYAAAAVHTACKCKNVKVEYAQLLTISRLKRPQWKEITSEFEKFAESIGLSGSKKNLKTLTQKSLDRQATNETDKSGNQNYEPCIKEDNVVEDYDVWKSRILREATEEIFKRDFVDS